MTDALADFLEHLEKAKGDPHAQSVLAAEFALTALPESERQPLRAALDAAAVLRWFDAGLLGQFLEVPHEVARTRFEALTSLPFVERYRMRDTDLRNIHEATRLGWRKKLADETPDRFRGLSLQAAEAFADDPTSAGRIEWVYNLLCGDPDRGATELEELNRDWYGRARPEDRYALAAALRELEDTGLVAGRARAWTLLFIAWTRVTRGETAQLADTAAEALQLARAAEDRPAEADAQCLLGDVRQAQGNLEEAQAAFGEYLSSSRRLAEQNPSNADWQWELAVAHRRVGGVLEAQGRLKQAQAVFGEGLSSSRRLAEQNPSNTGWQRELAVAHNRVGGVLEAQGRLKQAQAAFGEGLSSSRRLAEQDPSNADLQRELAVAHGRVGKVLEAQGRLKQAQAAFGEGLSISRRLAEQDPSNAEWQRDLAVACLRLAGLEANANRHDAALPLYEEASRIFAALSERAPGVAQWSKDRETVESELARCRSRLSAHDEAGTKSWIERLRHWFAG